MKKHTFTNEIWSALTTSVVLARRHDFVVVVKESRLYTIYCSGKLTTEDITSIENLPVVLIFTRGKITKCLLDPEQVAFINGEIEASNKFSL